MAKDGFYSIKDMIKVEINKFQSEKHMKEFILNNINQFCNDVLGVKFKSFISEYKISDGTRKNKSIDLLITTIDNQKIAIELKNPKHKSELQPALGQCLVYITSLEISGQKIDRFILISSSYDFLIPITIKKMNIPIEFAVMDKEKFSKMILI
jgi:hypothetical protein